MSAIHILDFYSDVGFACALDKPFKAKYEPEEWESCSSSLDGSLKAGWKDVLHL